MGKALDGDSDGGSAIEKFLDYGAFIYRQVKYKRWQDLDDKAKDAFRKIVEPQRRANPSQSVLVKAMFRKSLKNCPEPP